MPPTKATSTTIAAARAQAAAIHAAAARPVEGASPTGTRIAIQFHRDPESKVIQSLQSRGFSVHDGVWYGIVDDFAAEARWATSCGGSARRV